MFGSGGKCVSDALTCNLYSCKHARTVCCVSAVLRVCRRPHTQTKVYMNESRKAPSETSRSEASFTPFTLTLKHLEQIGECKYIPEAFETDSICLKGINASLPHRSTQHITLKPSKYNVSERSVEKRQSSDAEITLSHLPGKKQLQQF